MAVSYVAYIDESGDPGIKTIKPGGSEWFMLSCLVAQAHNVPALGNTHESILSKFKNRHTNHLHFNKLIPAKKVIACEELARTPCRGFIFISNKKNIVHYKNPRMRDDTQWLYWWSTRILLEKVTDYCFRHAAIHGIKDPILRVVFSRRGGNSYDELIEYFKKIRTQSKRGRLFINRADIKWPLIDLREIHVIDSKNSIGLQFADVIAGSFHNSLHIGENGNDPEYARILQPIMGRCSKNRQIDFGVKIMPYIYQIKLLPEQRGILEHYGYKGKWA